MPLYVLTGDESIGFIKGVFDCAAGLSRKENPYVDCDDEYEDWDDGWTEEWLNGDD